MQLNSIFPFLLFRVKKKKRKTRDSFSNIHNNIALIALAVNRYSRLIGPVAITISINKLKTTGERERRKGDPLACMKIFYHNQLLDAFHQFLSLFLSHYHLLLRRLVTRDCKYHSPILFIWLPPHLNLSVPQPSLQPPSTCRPLATPPPCRGLFCFISNVLSFLKRFSGDN